MKSHFASDGMRMVERKQDALSTNFLIGLMDEAPKKKASKAMDETLHLDVRPQPHIEGDRTLQHLASRIVEEVTVSSTPRQLATQVLNQAGIVTKVEPKSTVNGHLKHVGLRAKKIPRSNGRKIRKVKRAAAVPASLPRRRGPPAQTRLRPSMGSEHDTAPPPRQVRPSRKKQSRRRLFRR
jgi:hypothetical protein